MLKIPRNLYNNLLKSQEYAPYLLFKNKADYCKVFIDMVNLPKDRYLPVNNNYADGLKLCWLINDSEKNGIILIEPIDE